MKNGGDPYKRRQNFNFNSIGRNGLTMTILITGSNGQLGMEVQMLLKEKEIPFVAYDREELDITDLEKVNTTFNKIKPTYIFHCAAFTAVDKAEDEGKELNELVNVVGSKNIALASEEVGATLIYISTDYVFDGSKVDEMYTEVDKPNPLNAYGKSKLSGENEVQKNCSKSYIIRTSWVFGQYGNNFVYTMKKLSKTMDKLTIVDDQIGRPTWTRTLSEFMLFLVQNDINYGIYNLSNDNSCSWYQFAQEILKNDTIDVLPISSSEFPQKALRPKYSVLDLEKAKNTGFVIDSWQEALAKMMNNSF